MRRVAIEDTYDMSMEIIAEVVKAVEETNPGGIII